MTATKSKRQISSVTSFRELMYFDEPNADIKSDYGFTKNLSQHHCNEAKKARSHSTKTVSSIHTLLAHQIEIKKLQRKVKQLESEKFILVKWINFLY
ncbi:MAG: hypothetical protein JKX67_04055 [Colwellia sp.]|nr:hypothetical protein [Colwellia sp.]